MVRACFALALGASLVLANEASSSEMSFDDREIVINLEQMGVEPKDDVKIELDASENLLSDEKALENLESKKSIQKDSIIIEMKELDITLGGGKSLKSKFIVDNKFVKPKDVIADLDNALKDKIGSQDEPNSVLNYEIHRFNIEENHGNLWVDVLLDYTLLDIKSGKIFKSQRVAKKYKSDLEDSGEIYKNAINLVAGEIYDDAFKQSSKHIDDKKAEQERAKFVKENSKGGVILPFD